MTLNNKCVFFFLESESLLKPFVYDNAMKLMLYDKVYTLDKLKEEASSDISTSQMLLKQKYPFRVRFCKYSGIKCCGSCTLTCNERCVQDIYTKLGIYLIEHCSRPYVENITQCDYLTRSIYNLLTNTDSTYDQLVAMVNQIIGVRQNATIKNKVTALGLNAKEKREMNVWRFDYAPQPEYYEIGSTGKMMRKVDKQTGKIQFRDWPDTGLCPYCLPKVTIDRHYGKNYDLL